MTDIKVFEDNSFGKLRVISNDGDNLKFVAADVCNALGLLNPSSVLNSLDEDEKGIEKVYTSGGKQKVLYVTESGLYSIIMRSNKPQARAFRRWVTGTVLPQIRKTGAFLPDQQTTNSILVRKILNDPDFAISVFEQLKQEREMREQAEMERDIAMRIRSIDTDMAEPSIIRRYIHGVVSGQTDSVDTERKDNYYKLGVKTGIAHRNDEEFKQAFCELWAGYRDYMRNCK